MATEEPVFTVESKSADLEIRRYGRVLVAETQVDVGFEEAGKKAFKILADYIFGNNLSKNKIAMTAPVIQQAPSQKIAMAAPVSQIKGPSGYVVQFTMPHGYTLETLPVPNDPRVHLREIAPRMVAVLTYTGSWSQAHYDEKLAELKSLIQAKGLKTVGEPIFARFNSPFQLWFLRRNEIWLELAR